MKLSLLVLSVVVATAAARPPAWHQLDGFYSYDQYLADFGKVAPSNSVEREMRASLFGKRLHEALVHNADSSRTWRRGINHMSDWTPEERHALRGRVAYTQQKPSASLGSSGLLGASSKATIPKSVDWREKGVVTPVKDQGHCGSCWAFASTAVLESASAIATGVLAELSPQFLVSCAPNPEQCGGTGGCSGSTAEVAYEYVKKHGMPSPYSFPYVSWAGDTNGTCDVTPVSRSAPVVNLTGFEVLPANDEAALLEAIATKGPVAVSVAAEPWMDYESGVFDGCASSGSGTEIDHAVVAVGYDEDSILIRNSWTPLWGEQGYIRLKRTAACGMDQKPGDGYACKGQDKPIKVCGMCGVLSDSVYPTGVRLAH